MIYNIRNFFKGDQRTVRAKKNMAASVILKGIDGIIYLAVVPLTLGFLDPYSYGLWLAISSILAWVNTFDIGLGNGLRNCLTRALAVEDYDKCRIYISTTYFLLTVIVICVYGVFTLLCQFIDWYSILKVDHNIIPNLTDVINYTFLFFCLSFILKVISSIYMSLQLPAVSNLFNALGYIVSMTSIVIMKYTMEQGSLIGVAIAFSSAPCIVYLIVTPLTFLFYYPKIRPSFRFIRLKGYVNDLLTIGVGFFILQICALVLQFSTNLVISNMFGPSMVTPFNISNRYMTIGIILMTIILSPIWSAVTDAHARGDMEWVKRTLSKIQRIMIMLGGFLLFLVLISRIVYHFWIGDQVEIPLLLTMLNAIYVYLIIWSSGQSTFLNGLNVLRIQLIANIFQAIIFFPLLFGLGKLFGIYGLVIGLTLANVPAAVMNTIQMRKIINNKAQGIWLK